jgi:hypothetical protein
LFRLRWKWRKGFAVKITERTRVRRTRALHGRREGGHTEAALVGHGFTWGDANGDSLTAVTDNSPIFTIPEPVSILLFGSAFVAVVWISLRGYRRQARSGTPAYPGRGGRSSRYGLWPRRWVAAAGMYFRRTPRVNLRKERWIGFGQGKGI